MLIAFMGPKGNGKSTAAQALIDRGFVPLSFAFALKETCRIVYGLTATEMEDAVLKETVMTRWPHLTPRVIMQQVGTELFRNFLDETWIRAFMRDYQGLADAGKDVVVTDLRFLNEARAVRGLGGEIIKVVDRRKEVQSFDLHASEVEANQIEPHHIIVNNSTIEALHKAVNMLVRE